MTTEECVLDQLGAVFDELVELVGQAKQAAWTASSSERRHQFDELMTFLGEQAAAVDEMEQRVGTRPPWVVSPTGHRPRNIAGEAGGDPVRMMRLLSDSITTVAADIRDRSASVEHQWGDLLEDIAARLEARLSTLDPQGPPLTRGEPTTG